MRSPVRDRRRLRIRSAGLVLAGVALSAAGCRPRGALYDCTCAFLTDFDYAVTQEVTVCAGSAERAVPEARGCAQTGAPAPIQGCSCRPASEGAECVVGECRVRRE
jgi:hypothetical protein